MKYTTVVFDLDGTLLDTLEDLMDAANYALKQHGYPIRTLPEIRAFVGNGAANLIRRALPDDTDTDADFENVLSTFRAYYGAHCEDKTRAYDGIPELIRQLSRAGCKLAIVSNKPDRAVKDLTRAYFQEYVHTAIGEKEGIRRKPAPDMVENALEKLQSSKKETVYIGDSDVDIRTAANSGLECISVSWGFRDADFLRENGATIIADTPQEVYEIITAQ